MSITRAEAEEITRTFVRDYPGALELAYKFREDVIGLYGAVASEVPKNMKGGYVAKETMHNGRAYRGRVDVPVQNMDGASDMMLTLRHEVLGHYGANTFTPAEKRALLDGLIAARNEPTLKQLWGGIDQRYADQSLDVRAEEIFALYCEGIEPSQHQMVDQVQQHGQHSFMETCIARVRPMQADDLHNISCMVAQGLRDRSRTQQTFPQFNEQFRKDETMVQKKPYHEVVAEKLIEQLKAGTAPWQRPWAPGEPAAMLPMNPATGNRYRGINAIFLTMQGRDDQRWMTYKQAAAVGAQVRKGEHGTPVQYWKFTEEQTKTDENGKSVLDAKGNPEKVVVRLERPRVFFATVFNGEQIDGLPPIERKPVTWNPHERAEHILQASGADIHHVESNRAFYRLSTDSIHLPNQGQFPTADKYYATALHELGHWTGHPSRLDRDIQNPIGSEEFAKEELRAEIASMLIGDDLGIGHDPSQHVAYVGSWIKALQDDPLEIFRACADAEKIHEFIIAQEQKQVQDQQVAQKLTELRENTIAELTATESKRLVEAQRAYKAAIEWVEQEKAEKSALIDAGASLDDLFQRHEAALDNLEFRSRDLADAQTDLEEAIDAGLDRLKTETVEARANGPAPDADAKDIKAQATIEAVLSDPDIQRRVAEEEAQRAINARTYINVPFAEKDEAKGLGAKWDRQEKSWFVPAGQDMKPFTKWARIDATITVTPQNQTPENQALEQRHYLAVPYEDRGEAKVAGALWDKVAKSWYAGPNANMAKLDKWMPTGATQDPPMSPQEEFAKALKAAGFILKDNHPVMDGRKHRLAVQDGKAGSLDGFYVGHLDGHPAGRIINNRTGTDIKWKAKGYALTDQQKAELAAQATENLQKRAEEQQRQQAAAASRVTEQMSSLTPVSQPTPYLKAKGIKPVPGVFTDEKARETFVPAYDTTGKQWTMQYIQEDGIKRFAKESRKEGCFHIIGASNGAAGLDALAKAPAIVIGEGYATASSVSDALTTSDERFPTVAAFDSGNLVYVAKALHEKYPEKPIIITGDDDKAQEAKDGRNPGRRKGEEAAAAVDGKVLLPIFAPGEQEQAPKQFSDFNDLANRSAFGRAGMERQIQSVVFGEIERYKKQLVERQEQQLAQKLEQRPRRSAKIG